MEMDEHIWTDNWACLAPYLRELLTAEQGTPVSVIRGRHGFPVALVATAGGPVRSNSLVDPWKEAEQWASTIAYTDMRVSFIYGCGFGYPLLKYGEQLKPYTETVIFERDIELFRAMLGHVDMRPLLRSPRVYWIVGNDGQMQAQMAGLLSGDFLCRCASLTATFTWLAHRVRKETYLALHEYWWNMLNLLTCSFGNSVHDTLIGLYNTLDNADTIARSPQLSAMRRTYAGRPAFIIANGPSLDRNIHQLRRAKDKALLLSAESALQPCLRRGIVPDAVCVTERSPDVYRYHFAAPEWPDELMLIGLTLIDPRIPQAFKAPWIPVFRRDEHTADWVKDEIAAGEPGLQGGTSSAHLAFEFALWAGADPIIFVGQDLAFGRNKETHSRLSCYAEARLSAQVEQLLAQPVFPVPGIDGEPVLTTKLWLDFKTWFEHQISLYPDRTFIDATEGGALIAGTKPMALSRAIDSFCGDPDAPEVSLYKHALNEQSKRKALLNEAQPAGWRGHAAIMRHMEQIRSRLETLARAADTDLGSCRLLDRALRIHSKYAGMEMPEFIRTWVSENSGLYDKYVDHAHISTFIQSLVYAFQYRALTKGEVGTLEKLIEWNGVQREMAAYLREVCALLAQTFAAAAARWRERAGLPEDEHPIRSPVV